MYNPRPIYERIYFVTVGPITKYQKILNGLKLNLLFSPKGLNAHFETALTKM